MDDDLVGKQLGKYEIRSRIGRGGMGTVYLGYDPVLDRRVAIKVLAPHLVWEEGFVDRFLREARTAARLKHPHIVTIYDVGQDGQKYYFVMEYVEGQALSVLIGQYGPPPPAQAIALLRPLAAALDYAHSQGLIHRDVKPGNIIVGPDRHVTLTDFGIARAVQETRLTVTGTVMGTPEYMSPEQAQGAEVDARSDQYSLAVVAYEMLSGQTPFGGATPHGVLYKQMFEPPPSICRLKPGLPSDVEAVLARALAKAPDARYSSGTEFVEALCQALVGTPAAAAAQEPVVGDRALTLLSGADRAAPPVTVAPEDADRAGRAGPTPVQTGTTPAKPSPPVAQPAVAARGRRMPRRAWLVGGLVVGVAAVLAVLLGVAVLGRPGAAPGTATSTSPIVRVSPTSLLPTGVILGVGPTKLPPTPAPVTVAPLPVYECRDPQGCVLVGPGQPVLIGAMLVLSGGNSSLGIDSRRAVEIAVADHGEVLGHPIELAFQDSLCTTDGGRAAGQKLAADPQLLAVVGPSCSSEARVAIPILCEAGVALVSPSSTSQDLTRADRPAHLACFLRTAHNDVAQAVAATQFLWEALRAKNAATIHDGSTYSDSLQQMFVDQFVKLGGAISGQQAIPATGGDVTRAVERTIAGKPDAVFAPLFIESGVAVVRAVAADEKARGIRVVLTDASFSADWLRAAGPAAVGTLFTSPDLAMFGPRYQELRKKYVDRYGQEPISGFHAQAYDATMMILAAIEKVAVLEPDGTLHIPRRGLIEALYHTRDLAGMTGILSCNSNGDCGASPIAVFEVVNDDPASWNPGAGPDSNPRRVWP